MKQRAITMPKLLSMTGLVWNSTIVENAEVQASLGVRMTKPATSMRKLLVMTVAATTAAVQVQAVAIWG